MIEIKVPEAGESVKEAMIGSWLVKDGDFVNQDDPMVELETDKASMEIVAEVSGVITLIAKEQDIVQVGQVIAKLAPQSATPNQPVSASETKSPHTHPSQQGEKTEVNQQTTEQTSRPQSFSHHGPAVDVMAAAAGIDATQLKDQGITGSGKEGRLTKGDMLDLITDSHHHQPKQSTNNNADERRSEKQPLSMMRRRIAERLLHATQQTAMLTTFNEVDMSAIINIRQKYKETFLSTHNVKLGFMSFFLRASVLALGKFPKVNAYIEDDHMVSHNYMDVGVAVATDKGLVVPVIRDAQHLSLAHLEQCLTDLAGKARNKKLQIEDMQGGTFTITNGGVFGSLLSTPILNPPQSAILGMHKIEQRPRVVTDGRIEARPMMYLALSYDHRIVDGKEAVGFLVAIKEMLEDPIRLLLKV